MTQRARTDRPSTVTAAAVAAALAGLLLAAPTPPAAVEVVVQRAGSGDPTAPLVAAVALLAWAMTGWLTLTVVLVALSQLPGLLGRAGRLVAVRVAPVAVRRAVEAALGVTVAVGALAPTAALAAAPAPPAVRAVGVTGTSVHWDLDWPSAVTGPDAPPPPPAPAPSAPPPPAPEAPAPALAKAGTVVVVQPGDSLWSLAERSLHRSGAAPTDRQVAQAWPRWWSANRAVIGDDPDLLLPGTRLQPPPADAA